MRYVAIGFVLLFACQRQPKTPPAPPSTMRASTLFTDSAIYRAQCKEADTLPALKLIPQKCTPHEKTDVRSARYLINPVNPEWSSEHLRVTPEVLDEVRRKLGFEV